MYQFIISIKVKLGLASFMLPATTGGGGIKLCFPVVSPTVRPLYVNSYFAKRDISFLSGRISMKLGINIHNVSGH